MLHNLSEKNIQNRATPKGDEQLSRATGVGGAQGLSKGWVVGKQ